MKEVMEDPGIKLFGKKIALPENGKIAIQPVVVSAREVAGDESSGGGVNGGVDNGHGGSDHDHYHGLVMMEKTSCEEDEENRDATEKDQYKERDIETKPEDESSQKGMAESDDNPKTPSIDEDTAKEKASKPETDQSDTTNSQPKTLKKPDKILPCPRCNSMDTKFCYYNNYNVNQPRHFCKSCQRYWTAGGTMRNMPVGAGRRKNKNAASNCRFLTISQEAFQAAAAQIEAAAAAAVPDGVHSIPPKVLSFGLDSPVVGAVSCRGRENGDDCSSGSTVTTSNSVGEKIQNKNGFHSQVPCIPGVSWSYNPWNSAIPIPAICPPVYPPMPFYPSPYWNCIPWLPPSSPITNQNSDPNSSTLGKHSRDGELIKPKSSEEEPKKQTSSVLIPKTLRIDDPDEAAKSSIWATLGIKNENISRGSLFKAFQAKGEEKKNHASTTSPVLQANPAALSRSLCFQERA